MQVGHVRINASREGTWLVLQVDDDGERLPPGWTCDGAGTSGSWRTPDEDSPRCLRRNRPWKHTRDKRTLVRLSLKSLADTLDPDRFVRVHRSTIVNIRHVRAIEQHASEASSNLPKREREPRIAADAEPFAALSNRTSWRPRT